MCSDSKRQLTICHIGKRLVRIANLGNLITMTYELDILLARKDLARDIEIIAPKFIKGARKTNFEGGHNYRFKNLFT